MKKAANIILLVLLVSIQTPVGEFLKFPILVEHFVKHQNKDGVSLQDFLEDHYNKTHHDADLPEDEQLPFKSNVFYAIGYAVLPGLFITSELIILHTDQKIIFPQIAAPQQHLASIFHPPQV